jgi:hypothetical protein
VALPHFHVVDDFAPEAAPLRAAFEQHFAEPNRQHLDVHGCWNYWYVPGLYTYLRANPYRVLPGALVDSFRQRLLTWSVEHLGCAQITPPQLALYVNGCRQGSHNDAENGRWAYVFSLTPPGRSFAGGATHLYRPEPYWDTDASAHAASGMRLYDAVAPEFNRLTIFDDRLIHAVEPVEGTLDPLQGRVVLHGHIREGEAWVSGALAAADRSPVRDALTPLRDAGSALAREYRGVITLRLAVRPDGRVATATVLSDLAAPRVPGRAADAAERARQAAAELVFPRARGESVVVAPVALDQPSGPSNASGT